MNIKSTHSPTLDFMRGFTLFAAWASSSTNTPPAYQELPTGYGASPASSHRSLSWSHAPYTFRPTHQPNAYTNPAGYTATYGPPAYGSLTRQSNNARPTTMTARPTPVSSLVPTNWTIIPTARTSSTVPPANLTISRSHDCADCLFGAATATLYSFPYTIVETLTVTVAPQLIVHPNGSRETSITTRFPPQLTSPSSTGTIMTFTDESEMTWFTQGLTMTYPTTYIEYASFERAALRRSNSSTRTMAECSGTYLATPISLPEAVEIPSLIYPWQTAPATISAANVTELPKSLPTALIDYLDRIGHQLSYTTLEGVAKCSPLLPPALVKPTPRPPRGNSSCSTILPTMPRSWNSISATGGILWRNGTRPVASTVVCWSGTRAPAGTSTAAGAGTEIMTPARSITTESRTITETISIPPPLPVSFSRPPTTSGSLSSQSSSSVFSITLIETISIPPPQPVRSTRTTPTVPSSGSVSSSSTPSFTTPGTTTSPPAQIVPPPQTETGEDPPSSTASSSTRLITTTDTTSIPSPQTTSLSRLTTTSVASDSTPGSSTSSVSLTATAVVPPILPISQSSTSIATSSSTPSSPSSSGAIITMSVPSDGSIAPPPVEETPVSTALSIELFDPPLVPTGSQSTPSTSISPSTISPTSTGQPSESLATQQLSEPPALVSSQVSTGSAALISSATDESAGNIDDPSSLSSVPELSINDFVPPDVETATVPSNALTESATMLFAQSTALLSSESTRSVLSATSATAATPTNSNSEPDIPSPPSLSSGEQFGGTLSILPSGTRMEDPSSSMTADTSPATESTGRGSVASGTDATSAASDSSVGVVTGSATASSAGGEALDNSANGQTLNGCLILWASTFALTVVMV